MKTIPIYNSADKVSPIDTICDLKWNYPIFNMDRGEFRSCCRTPSNKVTEDEHMISVVIFNFQSWARDNSVATM